MCASWRRLIAGRARVQGIWSCRTAVCAERRTLRTTTAGSVHNRYSARSSPPTARETLSACSTSSGLTSRGSLLDAQTNANKMARTSWAHTDLPRIILVEFSIVIFFQDVSRQAVLAHLPSGISQSVPVFQVSVFILQELLCDFVLMHSLHKFDQILVFFASKPGFGHAKRSKVCPK